MPVVYVGAIIGGFAGFKLSDGNLWVRLLWALVGAIIGALAATYHQ